MRKTLSLRSLALLFVGACSDPAATPATGSTDASITADLAADTGPPLSGYRVDLTFHGGPSDGQKLHLEQTQSAISGFAFGSTHKQYPAISLSINDHQSLVIGKAPASPIDFQINFGNLVGSATDPLQCGEAGSYPFSCKPPGMKLIWKGITFRSECAGLQGAIVVTDWASKTGGRFAGSFAGTLQGWFTSTNTGDDCADAKIACKNPAITVDAEGAFDFVLPVPDK
jgi:hypothetical protein